MGFVFSVFYFVTYFLTPATIFGSLAAYRIELILAILILFVSLPKLAGSIVLKIPQSAALAGLAFAASMSAIVETRWTWGAIQAFFLFLPNAYAYFLVCMHCNTKKKLQVIVLMLLFVCLFVIAHGFIDLSHGDLDSGSLQPGDATSAYSSQWDIEHPYLYLMGNDAGKMIYRLRGLGQINDPNDFAQLVVCVIPLVFIFWSPGKMFRNIAFVLLPVCVLLYGTFLTHSRGALLALMAMAVVAARRRIGTLPALLVAGGIFFAAMSLHFTGGRDISAESGSDRTELWGESMQLLKSHPLFGVGSGALADYLGHTAHNSVMVCVAELGSVGFYFWCLFLFPTLRNTLAIASPDMVSEAKEIEPEAGLAPMAISKIMAVDKAEINRLGRLLVLSFTGFLVAGWFLSRAFVMTFFLLGGVTEVIYEMAFCRGMIAPRLPFARVLIFAWGLAISLLLLMYILLRTVNLMH
jgi:hypothetical protein